MYTVVYTSPARSGVQIIVVKANGGSVKIEKQCGSDWVVCDTITADGAYQMNLGENPVRFTPSGGAAYEVNA